MNSTPIYFHRVYGSKERGQFLKADSFDCCSEDIINRSSFLLSPLVQIYNGSVGETRSITLSKASKRVSTNVGYSIYHARMAIPSRNLIM